MLRLFRLSRDPRRFFGINQEPIGPFLKIRARAETQSLAWLPFFILRISRKDHFIFHGSSSSSTSWWPISDVANMCGCRVTFKKPGARTIAVNVFCAIYTLRCGDLMPSEPASGPCFWHLHPVFGKGELLMMGLMKFVSSRFPKTCLFVIEHFCSSSSSHQSQPSEMYFIQISHAKAQIRVANSFIATLNRPSSLWSSSKPIAPLMAKLPFKEDERRMKKNRDSVQIQLFHAVFISAGGKTKLNLPEQRSVHHSLLKPRPYVAV